MNLVLKLIGFIILILPLSLTGQIKSAEVKYEVEPFDFTPPETALIDQFLDKKAENFLANDMLGNAQSISQYLGKNVLLAFVDLDNNYGVFVLEALDKINKKEDVQCISFLYGTKADCKKKLEDYRFTLPLIPNGKIFGTAVYAEDLGTPRVFCIDKEGVIKKVIPERMIKSRDDLSVELLNYGN